MHKVIIRPLDIKDASVSWKWRNDPEVWNYTGSRPDREITFEIELEWIKKVLNEKNTKRFAILVDETYVGNIQLTDITRQTAEYHIFIGEKSFWGKGIATLATFEILHYAKEELGLKNVYLTVREDNIYAIKSYLKSSFTKVSIENGWFKMSCDLTLLSPPTVSVFIMVYNHEKYIAECLDGILMQKCNFSYNIVVGEDASKDKTREILLDYCTNYPGKFKLILHEENIGAIANQMTVFAACTGKYIAICEGDDYWTDPLKLQKQVNFLEANPAYSLCFHNAIIKHEGKQAKDELYFKNKISDNIDIKKIIAGHGMPTASMLFKKDALEIPFWLNYVYNGDYAIRLILATKGTIGYLDELMTVYRKQPGGLNATMVNAKVHQHIIVLLSYFNIYTNFKYNDLIIEKINSKFKEYPFELIRDKSRLYRFLSIAYWEHRLGKTFKF